MSKFDDLSTVYANELRTKCQIEPDTLLLRAVARGCGPSIYKKDASGVASSDPVEVSQVRAAFLVGKLGLEDGPELDAGLDAVFDQYGWSTDPKHRAVVYYLLVKHFGKEGVYLDEG